MLPNLEYKKKEKKKDNEQDLKRSMEQQAVQHMCKWNTKMKGRYEQTEHFKK